MEKVYRLMNKNLAVEPFASNSIQKDNKLGNIVQLTSLTELAVVFTDEKVKDPKVLVRSADCVLPWAKQVYEVEGRKFILCPEDRLVMTTCFE